MVGFTTKSLEKCHRNATQKPWDFTLVYLGDLGVLIPGLGNSDVGSLCFPRALQTV